MVTGSIFQRRNLRVRMVKQLVQAHTVGKGSGAGIQVLVCQALVLILFPLSLPWPQASSPPWIPISLWCCAWNSLGLKCPCPGSYRVVTLHPRQKVSPTSLLSSFHLFIVLLGNALWPSPPGHLLLGQRNLMSYRSFIVLLSLFFSLLSAPHECLISVCTIRGSE